MARSSRQQKLNATHIDFIRQLLTRAKSNFLSINSIKKKLLTNFEEIGNISETTVRKIVSKDLRFSFKKLDKIEPKLWQKIASGRSWKICWSFLKFKASALKLSILMNSQYLPDIIVTTDGHQRGPKAIWSTTRTTSKWVLFCHFLKIGSTELSVALKHRTHSSLNTSCAKP